MWKIEVKDNGSWVEIRKQFSSGPCHGNLLVIVAKDGYDFGSEKREPDRWMRSTRGINVRISSNGPVALTFADWNELQLQVERAKNLLKE